MKKFSPNRLKHGQILTVDQVLIVARATQNLIKGLLSLESPERKRSKVTPVPTGGNRGPSSNQGTGKLRTRASSTPKPKGKKKTKPRETAKPAKKAKRKKKDAKKVHTPSVHSSRSFLQSIVDNNGLIERKNGTRAEYDVQEAKHLVWDRDMRDADKLWNEHHATR